MKRILLLLCALFSGTTMLCQTLTPSGTATFCAGGSVTLSVNNAPANSSFQWKKDGNNVGGNSNTFNANANGSYSVIITPGSNNSPDTLGPVIVSAVPNPVADFSFTPNNACSGTNVVFTSNASGGTPPYSYAWDFDDGATSGNPNPVHAFTSLGCGTGTFSVKLTVTDSKGCTGTVNKVVSVKQIPDVQVSDQNVFSPFNNCSNSPSVSNPNYTITINNSSPSAACINSYNVNWGDGNIQNNVTFPLTHTYTQLGAFNLVVTAAGNNGCNNSKTYVIANQSNPAGSLGTLGSTTNLCAPANVPFTISNWTLNSPGTSYILDFGDGTSITLNHPLNAGLTADTVNHIYNLSSCPNSSYTAVLSVVNACDNTPYTAGNIQIRIKPDADFSINTSPSCTGTQVCFNNNTRAGSYGPNCNTVATYIWDFGDGTPTSTQQSPCHIYTTPGTYTVTLSATNPCGTTTETKEVCIVSPLSAGFTTNQTSGCKPLTIQVTDTTNTQAACQRPTYKWLIAYTPAHCGTVQGYSFINGTTDTSANPAIRFDSAGRYTLTQQVTNACGTFTAVKTIEVKQPPRVRINIPTYPCGVVTISPTATVSNCGTSSPVFAWTFTGGSIAADNTPNPTVSFSTPGVHPIQLTITNECGTGSDTDAVVVSPAPDINASPDQTLCGGAPTTAVNFSSNIGTPMYRWTNSNPSVGLAASGTGNIASFTALNSGSTVQTAIIIVTPEVSTSCRGIPDTFTITVSPRPAPPAVTSPLTYCAGEPAPALTATPGTGNTLTWFTDPTLTGGTATAPVPLTGTPGSTLYYVTQTNSFNCRSDGAQISVQVNPGITGNTISASQQICAGTAPDPITGSNPTGGSGSYTYQWQRSATGSAPWTNIPGANGNTYSPPVLNDSTWYRRIVVSTPCSDTSNVIKITVQAALSGLDISAPQTICEGNTPALLTGQQPSGGGGNYQYQWFSSANNNNWTPISGATSIDYQPGVLNSTTYFRRQVTAAQCSANSASLLIRVNARPMAALTAAPAAICVDDPGTVRFTASAGSAPFQAKLVITQPGGQTDTLNESLNSNGPVNIPVLQPNSAPGTYTIALFSLTDQNGCINSNPSAVTSIRVKPLPVLTVSANPGTICNGTAAQLSVSGADSYTWSPAVSLNSSTGNTVSATPSVTTIYTVEGILEGCRADTVITVTVIPGATVANAGAGQLLCNVSNTSLAGNTPSANATGNWTRVSGPAAVIADPSNPATAVTGLQPGNTYVFRWTITGQAPCPPTTSDVQVDVLSPVTNLIRNDTIICLGQTATLTTSSLSGGSSTVTPARYTFQWESAAPGSGNWTIVSGGTNATLSVSPATNTCYRRKVFSNGECETISNEVCVTVNPAIQNNSIASSQQVCVNTAVALLSGSTPSGGDNVYTYSWETSTDSLNWTVIAATKDYQPPVYTAAGVHYFRRGVTSGNCTSMSNVVRITARPDAKAIFSASRTLACAPFDLAPVINVTHLPDSNGTYNWYADAVLFGSNNNGFFPGYTIPDPGDTVNIRLITLSPFGCKPDTLEEQFITVRTATARFSKDTSGGCGPLDVLFRNTSSIINPGIVFSWDFGNGIRSNLADPGIIRFVQSPFYSDTVYQVTLKAYNGCDTTTWRDSIRIRSNPKARFALDTTAGCSPFRVRITNNSLGIPNTYYWDFGNGFKDTTFSNGSFSYTYNIGNTVDTFPIRLIAANECARDTQIINVRVAPNLIRPQVTVSSTELFGCAPHAVTFNNATTGATRFIWDYGDGSVPDTTNVVQNRVTHVFSTPGTYNIAILMTNGCSDTTVYRQVTVYARPLARFSTSRLVYCLGDTLRVNNQSLDATNYRWFWGDGQSSSGTAPTHVYTTAGSYDILLRAERSISTGLVCFDTAVQSVTILTQPDVRVQTNAGSMLCAPFTLDAIAPGIINETVTWTITDSTANPSVIVLNGNSIRYTFSRPGTFSLQMMAVNASGCKDSTRQVFTVRGTPVASFTPGDISLCRTDTLISYLNTTTFNDFGPLTYRWLVDDVLQGTNGNFSYRYQAGATATLPKIFTTLLIATNSVGCSDTASATLQMNPLPEAQFSLGNTSQCVPFLLFPSNTSRYADSYQWWLNGAAVDTAAVPTFNINQAQTPYTISLVTTNQYGCTPDTFTTRFTTRVMPVAAFTVNDTLGCSGSLSLVTRNNSRFANSYTWDWGDASAGTSLPNPTHLYTTEGQYLLTLVASDGICQDTAYQSVYVSQKPLADFAVNDSVSCDTATIQFTNLSRNADGFFWQFSDGRSSTEVAPSVNFPPANGYYSVTLTAYNALGCKDSVIKPNLIRAIPLAGAGFVINPSPVISIPNYTFSFLNTTLDNDLFTYQWNLGDGSSANTRDVTHQYADTGIYPVRLIVMDNNTGCPDTVIRFARIEGQPGYLYVPNAFYPNSLQNQFRWFRPLGKGLKDYRFQVFDAWGKLLFETTELDAAGSPVTGWDGTYKGKAMPQDAYSWRISATFRNGRKWEGMVYDQNEKGLPGHTFGTVTLFR